MARLPVVVLAIVVAFALSVQGDLDANARRYFTRIRGDVLRNVNPPAHANMYAVITVNRLDRTRAGHTAMNPWPPAVNTEYRMPPVGPDQNYVASWRFMEPGRRPIHAEELVLSRLNDLVRGQRNVRSLYMLGHYSPCRACAQRMARSLRQHRRKRIYIGYDNVYCPRGMNRRVCDADLRYAASLFRRIGRHVQFGEF